MKPNQLQIRNSTAEFLIFSKNEKTEGIEVRLQDGTVWLSQRVMAVLFDTSSDNIGLHLKNIYAEGELNEFSTAEDFSVVRLEGNREVNRTVKQLPLKSLKITQKVNLKSSASSKICCLNRILIRN